MTKRDKPPSNPYQGFANEACRPERTILFDDEDVRIDPWLDALEAFDNGDKAPMIELMMSGYPLPKSIIPCIGDLLDRYDFKRPSGAPRKPAYTMTAVDVELNSADAAVDELMATGEWKLPDAVAEIAAQRGIPFSKLNEQHAGRRRSQRKR